MTITIAALRPTLERHLAERVAAGEVRTVGAHEYRVTGGRVRVQVRPERRLHAFVSFSVTRSSRGLTVQAIEMDYDAALTAAVIRYLLDIGIGVDCSVTTVAFSGAVVTDGEQHPAPPDTTPFEWR